MSAPQRAESRHDVCEPLCIVCGESASVYITGRDVGTSANAGFTELGHCPEHAAGLRADPLVRIESERAVS